LRFHTDKNTCAAGTDGTLPHVGLLHKSACGAGIWVSMKVVFLLQIAKGGFQP
jgi:hypothetical protein